MLVAFCSMLQEICSLNSGIPGIKCGYQHGLFNLVLVVKGDDAYLRKAVTCLEPVTAPLYNSNFKGDLCIRI